MNLYIYSEISEEQKEKVKNITPDTTIVIREANEEETIKILDTLLQLGIKSNIELTADDKEKFNHTKIFKDDKYDKLNIIIKGSQINSIKLTEYKYYENILYRFIEPAQNKNYSPFEKYIYAYNVTKRFKKYKESENRAESRDLYKLLESDYIVCAGYSNLLIDLLTKLGIPARFAKLTVATIKEGEETKNEYHARVAYSMKDPKYNIDGYYIADPTWDNSEEQDYYNFVALTSKEMNYGNRLIASKINEIYYNADELLFSETEQEFTDKVKYILNNALSKNLEIPLSNNMDTSIEITNYISKCKDKEEIKHIKDKVLETYLDFIHKLLDTIKVIDVEKYKEITQKYNIPSATIGVKETFYSDVISAIKELGSYFSSKVNNQISGSTIIDAAMVVNKNVLNLDTKQEEEYRNYLIEVNKERQSRMFPKRTIENATTGEVIYQNEENKFDTIYPQSSGKTL